MHSDLLELGWTDEQMNRIEAVVTEEAQKARVAAQALPLTGPGDPTAVAIPQYTLMAQANPLVPPQPPARLHVNSDPTLYLTKIAVNVYVRHREAADPELNAALGMFRRAANFLARIEDRVIVNGRPGANPPPALGVIGIPQVYTVTGGAPPPPGVLGLFPNPVPGAGLNAIPVAGMPGGTPGEQVVNAIIEAINRLDQNGQLGPFACLLSPQLFADIC